jgi:hypothetical protein
MRPEQPRSRWSLAYQGVVLGISAMIIVFVSVRAMTTFESAVSQPGALSLGLAAAGQVVGAAPARGPAAETLPGMVGTATPSLTPTLTPTRSPTPSQTTTATPTPSLTPDIRVYDPTRAKALLAQAETSWPADSPTFAANVNLVAQRISGHQIAPGTTFSFNTVAGPYTVANGYQSMSVGKSDSVTRTVSTVATVDSGITQVSTTLFQAAFWSGLKIVERAPHSSWLDRLSAGSTGQRGLDAYVAQPGTDLRFANNTPDWIRIEAMSDQTTLTVSIFGADPGWTVNPNVGTPSKIVQPNPTPFLQTDPALAPGQQFTVSAALPGFDAVVERTVTKNGQVVDRYGVSEHYQPVPAILAVGPQPTSTPTIPVPTPTRAPVAAGPPPSSVDRLAGLNPGSFVLADGRIRTPNLVGVPEGEAQQVLIAVGLMTTYVNYQGPSDVPAAVLNSVSVGAVLSQNPAPGTAVGRGATVYLAVRKS